MEGLLSTRKVKNDDSIIDISGRKIGASNFGIIAGPCSVESEEQILEVARSVKNSGANFLRGGAFKPRTSPYSFQGLELEGLKLLEIAKKETGLPIVSELMSIEYLDRFLDVVDVIQVGARNMQNFSLLKELGKISKPVLLKRGIAATIEEWLMSAEYILSGGNNNVILCERGIRGYDSNTRNVLDIQAVPVIKKLSHLPIIVDPSHAGGYSYMVPSMAKAAVAAGANGIMVEVHNNPQNALSDPEQCLDLDEFSKLMIDVNKYLEIEGKTVQM